MVPVIPLVLFSGFDVDIRINSGNTYIVLEDGWIIFRVEEHRVSSSPFVKSTRFSFFFRKDCRNDKNDQAGTAGFA